MSDDLRRQLEIRVINAIVDLAEHMDVDGFVLPVPGLDHPAYFVCWGTADGLTAILHQQVSAIADAPAAPANDDRA